MTRDMVAKREYSRRYREEHKEQFRKYNATYRKQHPVQYKIESFKKRERMRFLVLTAYSSGERPKCSHCGTEDIDVLCIDHVENNGASQKKNRNGGSLYQWLKTNNFPSGYRVLCWNCNHKKELARIRQTIPLDGVYSEEELKNIKEK